jgi:hypothetical protein
VDDDPVIVVLVESDVGEELTGPVVPEGCVGEGVAGMWARATVNFVGIHGDCAGGDPRGSRDHAFPTVAHRLDPPINEGQVRLIVHAVEALDDRVLDLVHAV